MKMILTGQRMSSARAFQLGIVQQVYGCLEELHKGQLELAEEVSSNSLYTLSLAKESTKFSFEEGGNAARMFERATWKSTLSLPGGREGITAFINKKKPNFDGI